MNYSAVIKLKKIESIPKGSLLYRDDFLMKKIDNMVKEIMFVKDKIFKIKKFNDLNYFFMKNFEIIKVVIKNSFDILLLYIYDACYRNRFLLNSNFEGENNKLLLKMTIHNMNILNNLIEEHYREKIKILFELNKLKKDNIYTIMLYLIPSPLFDNVVKIEL